MGQWTYVHLHRNNRSPLTVITVYQVCKSPTNKLGGTAWHQQRRALDKDQRTDEHPREAFMRDLIKLIRHLQQKSHDIVIGGDWNETMQQSRSKLLKLCTELGLVDPWLHFHPAHDEFATQERGSQRIDSVLVSHSLLSTIEAISYSPIGIIQNNDHRTILLQMSQDKLFGQHKVILSRLHERGVRSNDKIAVTKYVETMFNHLQANSVFKRSKDLDHDTTGTAKLAENIDSLIGIASDVAEKACRKRRPEWFSAPLTKQRLTVSFLKHYLNGLIKSIDRSPVISKKLSMIDSDIKCLPTDVNTATEMLNEHKQRLAHMTNNSQTVRHQTMETQENTPGSKIRKHEIALSTWNTIAFLKMSESPSTIDRLEIPEDWPPPFTTLSTTTSLTNPKETAIWRTITKPDEIEYYLLLRNRLHFGQAQGTPFTFDTLQHDIPWGANSPQSEAILQGKYIPANHVPTICKEVLYACQQRQESPAISGTLTYESFRGKMRKWRESTVTSPSAPSPLPLAAT